MQPENFILERNIDNNEKQTDEIYQKFSLMTKNLMKDTI